MKIIGVAIAYKRKINFSFLWNRTGNTKGILQVPSKQNYILVLLKRRKNGAKKISCSPSVSGFQRFEKGEAGR